MSKRILTALLTLTLVFSMTGFVRAEAKDTKDDDPYDSRTKYGEHEIWVENIFVTEDYSDTSVTVVLNLSELTDDECQTFIDEFQAKYGFVMSFLFAYPNDDSDPEFECVDSKLTTLADESGNAFVITYECNDDYESLEGADAAFALTMFGEEDEGGSNHTNCEVFFEIDKSYGESDEDIMAYYKDAQGRSQVNLWKAKYYVDDFGRETEDPYIQNTEYNIGTFSNSVTTGSKLSAILFVDEDSVGIRLVEYGNYVVKNSYSKSIKYNVSLLDTKENRTDGLIGTIYSGGDVVYFSEDDSRVIINALRQSGEVSILLVDAERRTDKYLITLETEGFEEFYTETFY